LNDRSRTTRLVTAAAWSAPLAAGALLRLWNLPRQILVDDEIHTVATALYLPVRDILSSWKSEDPCLPLAALHRVMLESGVLFSEMTFRAPVLLASLATILILPWLARPLIGRRPAVLFAWLLAVSPVLAIYGRLVRPYGVIGLLAPAATLLVLRWRASGRLGWGVAYAVVSALCLWFHLAMAPLLVAPFGLLLLERVSSRPSNDRRAQPGPVANGASMATAAPLPWAQLGVVAILTLALVALYMVPGWESLRALYAGKTGFSHFSLAVVPPVLELQAGATYGRAPYVTAFLFWCTTVFGAVVAARSRPAMATYCAIAILAQWVGLVVLSPWGIGSPVIFNRYLIGALPLVLALTALGLEAIAARALARAPALLAASAIALLAMAGPFADPSYRRSSLQHSKDFIFFYLPRGRMDGTMVPHFYRTAEVLSSTQPIIELPFLGGWAMTRAHYVYQDVHGAPVIAAELGDWPCDSRLRLRNHVCPEPPRMLDSRARFLVVHHDPLAEELLIEGGDNSGNGVDPPVWTAAADVAARTRRGLRRRWGPAYYHDERITVWDLDAVRRRRARAGGETSTSPASDESR
jgi:hypothetical protein